MSLVGQVFVGTSQGNNVEVVSGFLADTLLRGIPLAVAEENILPLAYSVFQNYPNPFNSSTQITYELPKASHISLRVFNTLGQEVAVLVDEEKPAGKYRVMFNAGNLSSGVYFYRLSAMSPGDLARPLMTVKKAIVLK